MKKISASAAFKSQELEDFCINDAQNPNRFPQGTSKRRAFIFQHTGHSAKPMSWRDWYCFNASMNAGLDIGLPTDGHDRSLMMLSLIDHALAEVPRFVGMNNMPPMRADSTAGHSKQVMNIVQTVFENSGVIFKNTLSDANNKLRRDALLGAWIHDMGETIFELTTASDMFNMAPADAAIIRQKKNVIEDRIFPFCCQLAVYAIEQGKPELFHQYIAQIRDAALDTPVDTQNGDAPLVARIKTRMVAIEKSMDEISQLPNFPLALAPETKNLMDVYHRTEMEGGFLHPFVKTLEAVEGQRYLQRNAADSSTDALSRRLHPDGKYTQFARHDLSSDHEVISSIQRVEKRLPDLFEIAKTSAEKELAKAAARFTYRSIARQFTPSAEDHVGLAPAIIDRNPAAPTSDPHLIPLQELEVIRSSEMEYKAAMLGKQDAASVDERYYTRERAGALYRAAEQLVGKSFKPKSKSLISINDTPTIPSVLAGEMQKREMEARGTIARFPIDSASKGKG